MFREHNIVKDKNFVKDLSRIGRDLSKVIIIDNMPHSFSLQKENGILIKPFYGDDKNDDCLLKLIPILLEMFSII